MKLIFALAVAALACTPALAGETGPGKGQSRKDPDEVICKVQQTTAGIPQRICATRKAWARENERTRQDMMLNQRAFCVGGSAC
jgi:hypothetical protein